MRANPSLYQVNLRAWLFALSVKVNKPCQLKDIPDAELDDLAVRGFDWLWLLGIWQTGGEGRRISREIPELRASYRHALRDLEENDVTGSTFAIQDYRVHSDFGGDGALAAFRERLRGRGMRLLLDFVPNHTAVDHPWIYDHPEYYVAGSDRDLEQQPRNYIRLSTRLGEQVIAHGRDPYFPGWTDTAQLNYGNPALQLALREALKQIAKQCDGVRCDMAMLVLPEVFRKTWNIEASAFWPGAIECTRQVNPEFCFMAEVYWGLEWELQQQGFDYTYDKSLYDHLTAQQAESVRESLKADLRYQRKLVRFLENHDEPRAAAIFPPEVHRAAAVITYLLPGMRFFHAGQLAGALIKPAIQLRRYYPEPPNTEVEAFYGRLLDCVRRTADLSEWRCLEPVPAWPGNWTHASFICFAWAKATQIELLVAINFSDHDAQCYLTLPYPELADQKVRLEDLTSTVVYERDGSQLMRGGLYLDMGPWQYHVFAVETL